jgi:ATP-dependent helicase/nuclease subunit A
MTSAAEQAAPFYAAADIIGTPKERPDSIPASSLRYAAPDHGDSNAAAADSGVTPDAADPLGLLLQKAGLEHADFGSIVHGCLEALLNGRTPLMPPRILARLDEKQLSEIRAAALSMAEGFLDSELGKLSRAAVRREPEFPILTSVRVNNSDTVITGQIDLLFEEGETVHVVDFKTDRVEDPDQHLGQLAVYARAAGDIFKKPVRTWLFYLRGKKALELSDSVARVDIEALAAAWEDPVLAGF